MTGRVVSVAAVLVLAVVAVVGWVRPSPDTAARNAVEQVAVQFTAALLAYDHGELDDLRERVQHHATEDLATTVGAALDDLAAEITRTRASATVAVDRVLVDTDVPDRAHAVVVVDSTITSTEGTRELTDLYVELTLVRADGRWLVGDLTRLAAQDDDVTPAT